MSDPQSSQRNPSTVVPLTPQEIERKLGSPTAVTSPPSIPIESVELQRRLSNQSRKGSTPQSGAEEEETSYPSPPRQTIPLAAISETDDALASGSESDASSDGEQQQARRLPRQAFIQEEEYAPSRKSRDSGGLSENIALKSGYLMKKGERRKAWKKRWFVLRGGNLAMYKSDKEYRLLRLIPITEIHMAAPIGMKKHLHTFGIVTPRRTYYVKSESDREAHEWCQYIERARVDAKVRQTVGTVETPTEEDNSAMTPIGHHSPAQTPTGYASPPISSSTLTSAIPIPNAQQQPYQHSTNSFDPHSYATTASTSLTSPSVLASSSYTSTSSIGGQGQGYAPQLSTSPQSNAQILTGESDLQQLSSDVERLRLPGRQGLTRTLSSGSESLAPPVGFSASSTGGYDSTSSYDARASQPSPSPGGGGGGGIVSSSEDEDGFEAYAGPDWRTPGVAAAGGKAPKKQQHQQQQDSYFQQQPQQPIQSPPAPPSLAPVQQQLAPPAAPITQATDQRQGGGGGQRGFADPNKVILAGYLMKQGKRKTWRKRWFVLMSGMLMYSKSHMDTRMHRQIPLSAILDAIEYEGPAPPTKQRSLPLSPSASEDYPRSVGGGGGGGDGKKNYEHCFKIITPKRTYLVCAPGEEDEIKWLAALQCLVARKSSQGTPNTATSNTPASSGMMPPSISSPLPSSGSNPQFPSSSSYPQERQRSQDDYASSTMTNNSNLAPPPSSTSRSPNLSARPAHGRNRSLTEAAQNAVRDVEKRFHFQTSAGGGGGGVRAQV
ncbi:uncharacterized protein JCM6883_000586 [Sporobolomyces salmoneus]|uniref:uncharacterized protein n=1 Tax=Sporobolomyces salmoneus TaxID=183962 RepID=UPI003175431D